MAVTITVAELVAALRLTSSVEETAEVTRLHEYATEAVVKYAPKATDAAHNEAVRRVVGYLHDQPEASMGDAYANAMRSSGTARALLPYRIHRAGYSDAEAVTQAQSAGLGATGNPVTNVAVVGHELVVTYQDGTAESFTITADTGGAGADQTARNAAATAQSEIDAHEASTHNTDTTARSTARNARQTGEQAQTTIETHEALTHNTDTTARNAAAAAQTAATNTNSALVAHEANHPSGGAGTDQTARDAAAAAQSEIDTHEVSTHNTDTVARSTARNARQTAEQAQTGLETHEASTHNTDAGARTAAANAQSAVEDHERTIHNTDTTARDAAAAAQTAAEAAAGGRPTVLYEAATAAIGTSTGLITGNVVCPATGELEFYFEGLTGSRQGGVAYARVPAARIRGAVSGLTVAYNNDNVNVLVIAHGANRGIGVAVQATTNYMMLNAQAPGNFYVRIGHIA